MTLINLEKMPLVTEADFIKQICKPLKTFEITGFWYMRVYPDGTFLDLGTHLHWASLFFENLYKHSYEKKDIQMHAFFREDIALWDHNSENKIWQEGKEFSVGHGVSITKNSTTYVETYAFYTRLNNHQINNFYVNNLPVLENFIAYFHEKAASLITKADAKRFVMPEKYKEKILRQPPPNVDLVQKFLITIGKKRHLLNATNYKPLTYKELECLVWLCLGKSAEEISILLNCSKRTVETHIEHMKTKFNCNKTTSLIYTATSLGLLPYPESLKQMKEKME